RQFFPRPGLALQLLRNELPGPLNLLQDVLAGVLSAPALQSPARRERGEDDDPQTLAAHRNPSKLSAELMPVEAPNLRGNLSSPNDQAHLPARRTRRLGLRR